jgi:hypothetical protein
MSDPPNEDEFKKWLSYIPHTGTFIWISGRYKGLEAGFVRNDGYVQIKFKNRPYLAHRLAWLLMTGNWPTLFIDHLNHDKSDNSFVNLREVTKSENCQNVKRKGTRQKNGRYDARIMADGVSKYLGSYETEDEAKAAYLTAKKTLHSVASDNCFKGN